jgi:hypothetical protein
VTARASCAVAGASRIGQGGDDVPRWQRPRPGRPLTTQELVPRRRRSTAITRDGSKQRIDLPDLTGSVVHGAQWAIAVRPSGEQCIAARDEASLSVLVARVQVFAPMFVPPEAAVREALKRRANRALLGDVRRGLALHQGRPISGGRAWTTRGDRRHNTLRLLCTQEVGSSNLPSSTQKCYGSRVKLCMIRGISSHDCSFSPHVPVTCHRNVTDGSGAGSRCLRPPLGRAL